MWVDLAKCGLIWAKSTHTSKSLDSKDIVAYFKGLEKEGKIKTAFAKNRAEDVTRVNKLGLFLQDHHLLGLYETLG